MVWFKSLSMLSDLMLFIIIPIVSVVDVVAGLDTLEVVVIGASRRSKVNGRYSLRLLTCHSMTIYTRKEKHNHKNKQDGQIAKTENGFVIAFHRFYCLSIFY